MRTLIAWAGDDPAREGLRDTPRRVTDAFEEYFSGYRLDPADVLSRTFDEAGGYDDLVMLRDIRVESHCEHHMAPFLGVAHVAYLPKGRIVGISKIARVVEIFAKRLQTQETMTAQIADAIEAALRPRGVAVLIEAEHQCMSTRGVRQPGVKTITTRFTGALESDASYRDRFLQMVHGARASDGLPAAPSSGDPPWLPHPTSLFAARGTPAEIESGPAFQPKFDADGLIPAIVTDAASGEVLMFAWMNAEALAAHARDAHRPLLEPLAGQALEEGRGERQRCCASSRCAPTATRTRLAQGRRARATASPATPASAPASTARCRSGTPPSPDLPPARALNPLLTLRCRSARSRAQYRAAPAWHAPKAAVNPSVGLT